MRSRITAIEKNARLQAGGDKFERMDDSSFIAHAQQILAGVPRETILREVKSLDPTFNVEDPGALIAEILSE